jgi:hypothetical protein
MNNSQKYSNTKTNEMKNNHFYLFNTTDLPGYLPYPPEEDIYKRASKVEDIDFEDMPRKPMYPSKWNEKTFEEDPMGEDLDVPGSELDDEQEAIGSEDEENNLGSLAQDEQSDIEEND